MRFDYVLGKCYGRLVGNDGGFLLEKILEGILEFVVKIVFLVVLR